MITILTSEIKSTTVRETIDEIFNDPILKRKCQQIAFYADLLLAEVALEVAVHMKEKKTDYIFYQKGEQK